MSDEHVLEIDVDYRKWTGRDFLDFRNAVGKDVQECFPEDDVEELNAALEKIAGKKGPQVEAQRADLLERKAAVKAFHFDAVALSGMAWISLRRSDKSGDWTFDRVLDEIPLNALTDAMEAFVAEADPTGGAGSSV